MKTKNCPHCKKIQNVKNFHKNGIYYQSWCKKCCLGRDNKEAKKKYAIKKRKEDPESFCLWQKKYRLKNQDKINAQGKTNRAIKNGKLKRKKCRDCERLDTHGHHYDYSKPLKVVWLCPVHHKREHIIINKNK
jgi:hypothetical protein